MNYLENILSLFNSYQIIAVLSEAVLKTNLLLIFIALFCFIFRRFSSANRHLLWTLSLYGSILLPFLSPVLNVWQVPILPAQISPGISVNEDKQTSLNKDNHELAEANKVDNVAVLAGGGEEDRIAKINSGSQSIKNYSANTLPEINNSGLTPSPQKNTAFFLQLFTNLILAGWLAGVLLLLGRLAIGISSAIRLARRGVKLKDPMQTKLVSELAAKLSLKRKVRVLRSNDTLMPMASGILSPAVLLPAGADRWSEQRLRIVLLHELAHIKRWDCLTQILARAACAFYWFNPVVWYAAGKLRLESERACDDYVISVGAKPSDYAHHLLEIGRSLRGHSVFRDSATVAMARGSQLEKRLLAILDKRNGHQATSRLAIMSITSLVCILLLSLTLVTAGSAEIKQSSETALISEAQGAGKLLPEGATLTSLFHVNKDSITTNPIQKELQKTPQINAGTTTFKQEEPDNKPAPENSGSKSNLEINGQESDSESETKSKINSFVNVNYQEQNNSERQEQFGSFIEEMASVGYTNLSAEQLINLKNQRITADYVRSLRALGFVNITPDELLKSKIFKITPDYVKEMEGLGFRHLSIEILFQMRTHNITPDFIRQMRSAGFAGISAPDLINFKNQGITLEFINFLRAEGFNITSEDAVISLKNNDVMPEFILKVKAKGFTNLTLSQLVSLRIKNIIN